jgi:predicted nucleic acid-binding protein
LTFYFDTSFLAPLILEETTSAAVERFLASLPVEALAISHWTRVEFSSLLAREVRMGGMEPRIALDADQQFEATIAESFAVLVPAVDDFELAKRYLAEPRTGLRAGDALHLAIAANNGAEVIYSLDKTLLRAGKTIGLPVRTGIQVSD